MKITRNSNKVVLNKLDVQHSVESLKCIENLSDHDVLMEIYSFIKEMKAGYDKVVENAHIDRETLEVLLGVSERTLQRWRTNGSLRYYLNKDGSTYYVFKEVYKALKEGKLTGKCLKRLSAMKRMNSYSIGILKGFNSDEIEFEDF